MHTCKGCLKRWVNVEEGKTCHSSCEEYLAMVEQNKIIQKKRYEDHLAPRYDRDHGQGRSINPRTKKRYKEEIGAHAVRKE